MTATMTQPAHEPISLQTANPADRVALRGVRLAARVAGMSLKATLEQTFVNLEDRAIEAVYTFPLPEAAAVCGFEVVFFDRVFTGVVEQTDKAIEKYDDAIAEGHGAYLLEQHRPDVFTVRVGNLKPRQAVTIRLSYVADVEIVDRKIRLAFPTTIAPRYVSSAGTDPIDAAIDGDALNPPHVLSVPYGLSMDLELDLGHNLRAVDCRSHKVFVNGGVDGAKRVVTFAGGIADMDRDIVLTLDLAKDQHPFALAATSPAGEQFLALNFLPTFDPAEDGQPATAAETVFVLDCSGSMEGESIVQATAALECCLRAMSNGDPFNVCRFGSSFELLSPEPLIYSDKTLKQALAFVRQGANLGGTELLPALEAILSKRPFSRDPKGSASPTRNVVLLTDGQVSNEPATIAYAKRSRSRNRVFTFGIGASVSQFLVTGLARATGGAAEFISAGERIEDKVLRTFGRIASPPVSDVEIDWGNADAQVAPRTIPPLFDGDALRVFARVPGKLPDRVTLKCNTPAGPKSWTLDVRPGDDPANVLPALWARAMIRTLEEDDGVHPSATISGPASADGARLIDISKKYNLICGLTSFIAVEHRSLEDRNAGQPALRRVPNLLTAGWGGVEADAEEACFYCIEPAGVGGAVRASVTLRHPAPMAPASSMPCAPAQSPAPAKSDKAKRRQANLQADAAPQMPTSRARSGGGGGAFGGIARMLRKGFGGGGGDPADRANFGADRDAASEPLAELADFAADDLAYSPAPAKDAAAGKPGQPAGDDLVDLLNHQSADGSFDPKAPAARHLKDEGHDPAAILKAIDRLLDDAAVPAAKRPAVRHTLLVLIALRLAFEQRAGTWARAYKKAAAWLATECPLQKGQLEAWITTLEARFAKPD